MTVIKSKKIKGWYRAKHSLDHSFFVERRIKMKKKLFIICSKRFYEKIPPILKELEKRFIITLPNCYDAPDTEFRFKEMGREEHAKFKSDMIRHSEKVIKEIDMVLVLNFDKGEYKNYIGGCTFLEMYDAFRHNKTIYIYNDIPEGILKDEIIGFNPVIINGDLEEIK